MWAIGLYLLGMVNAASVLVVIGKDVERGSLIIAMLLWPVITLHLLIDWLFEKHKKD